jgi:Nitroreductase family
MLSRRTVNLGILSTAGLAGGPTLIAAADMKTIDLPPPWKDGGKPLAQVVWARRSIREFVDRPVLIEVLSNLLWSACGVNRPDTADRTVPSWRHAIESEIFVAAADGAWNYDAKAHRLTQVLSDDIRAQTGMQDFVGSAPLDLIYVADGSRLEGASPDEKRLWAYTDTGFIGQNVYLFCASEGLATVFRGSVNRTRLAQTLGLPATKFVTCAQTVGYPKG